MTTIGYMDRTEGKTIRLFCKQESRDLYQQKRIDRIKEALSELKPVGNIVVYLIQGNKQRVIFVR